MGTNSFMTFGGCSILGSAGPELLLWIGATCIGESIGFTYGEATARLGATAEGCATGGATAAGFEAGGAASIGGGILGFLPAVGFSTGLLPTGTDPLGCEVDSSPVLAAGTDPVCLGAPAFGE